MTWGDISSASFDEVWYDFTTPSEVDDGFPWSIFFSPDGTKLYVQGAANVRLYQYSLSPAWNLSGVSYTGVLDLFSSYDAICSIYITPDGSKLFVLDDDLDEIHRYTLSSAWNVSSATIDVGQVFDVTEGFVNNPTDMYFKPDGTKMYVMDRWGNFINEYELTTPWDLTTAVELGWFEDLDFDNNAFRSFRISPDGTKMYISELETCSVIQYNTIVPWDITVAVYADEFSFLTESGDISAMHVRDDGSKMYLADWETDEILQYSIDSGVDPDPDPEEDDWNDIDKATYDRVSYDFSAPAEIDDSLPWSILFSADGSKMYVYASTGGTIYQYSLNPAWSLNNPAYSGILDLSSFADIRGIYLSPNGSFLFFVDDDTDRVYKYSLSSAWDITTATSTGQSYDFTGEFVNTPVDLFFKPDGSRMFIMDRVENFIEQYSLSTPWDLTTVTDDGWFDDEYFYEIENAFRGFRISPDGMKLYVIETEEDSVHQYNTPTPWDISAAEWYATLNVSSEVTSPAGLEFKSDGSKLYILAWDTGEIHQYSTAEGGGGGPGEGDGIGLAEYTNRSVSFSDDDTKMQDFAFSKDGTNVYLAGEETSTLFQYSLSTPFDISTISFPAVAVLPLLNVMNINKFMAVRLNDDGSMLYILDVGNGWISQFNLATPWDISTAGFWENRNLSAVGNELVDFWWRDDGSRVFMIDRSTSQIHELSAPDAYSSESIISTPLASFDYSANASGAWGLAFNRTGDRFYLAADSAVHEYHTAAPWDISEAEYVESFSPAQTSTADSLFVRNETLWIHGYSEASIFEYDIPRAESPAPQEAWSMGGAIYTGLTVNLTDMVGGDAPPYGIRWSNDGLRFYFSSGAYVYQCIATVPYDISTLSYSGTRALPLGDGSVNLPSQRGLWLSTNGDRIFVLDYESNAVYQYTLSTPWNIGSMNTAYAEKLSITVPGHLVAPWGITFSDNGLKMYVSCGWFHRVSEYTLSVAWDISSATFTQSAPFAPPVIVGDNLSRGICIRGDGSRIYYVETDGDKIHQFDFGTPLDVSTLTYDEVYFNCAPANTAPVSLCFDKDGGKAFVTGNTHVFEIQMALVDEGGEEEPPVDDEDFEPLEVLTGQYKMESPNRVVLTWSGGSQLVFIPDDEEPPAPEPEPELPEDAGFTEIYPYGAARGPMNDIEVGEFLPADNETGQFIFPEPYGTRAIRITNPTILTDGTIPSDPTCRKINNHEFHTYMLVLVANDDGAGFSTPRILKVDKETGTVADDGPIYSNDGGSIPATTERWFWSQKNPFTLWITPSATGTTVSAYNADPSLEISGTARTFSIFNIRDHEARHGIFNAMVKKVSVSADDNVIGGIVTDSAGFPEGLFAYTLDADKFIWIPAEFSWNDIQECFIDRSGKWLAASIQITDGYPSNGTWHNIFIEINNPSNVRFLSDQNGSLASADIGFNSMIGADNWGFPVKRQKRSGR